MNVSLAEALVTRRMKFGFVVFQEPVWLNLTSTVESKQRECSERFMKCFLDLYKTCESKESS